MHVSFQLSKSFPYNFLGRYVGSALVDGKVVETCGLSHPIVCLVSFIVVGLVAGALPAWDDHEETGWVPGRTGWAPESGTLFTQ